MLYKTWICNLEHDDKNKTLTVLLYGRHFSLLLLLVLLSFSFFVLIFLSEDFDGFEKKKKRKKNEKSQLTVNRHFFFLGEIII